jgi:hypothetical protein
MLVKEKVRRIEFNLAYLYYQTGTMNNNDLDDYRERQRQRWSGNPASAPEGRTITPPPESRDGSVDKVHILPVGEEVIEPERETSAFAFLSSAAQAGTHLEKGSLFTDDKGRKFAVVATMPSEGGVPHDRTELYVNGPYLLKLEKLQLVALCSPSESEESTDQSSDRLFQDIVAPYMRSHLSESHTEVVSLGHTLKIGDSNRFVPIAMEPSPDDGLAVITTDTMVYIDTEHSGEFERIHVLPFQDTLPRVYDFDVFGDYLEPYFTMNPLALYSVNTQFAFHGVQFKVVCVDPSDGRPRRIGPNTIIHSEGLLHATLRNMLPPELLAQLSTLPPGLQMLLLNTELLASADVLDRFIDLQETLAARRGVGREVVEALPTETFRKPEAGTEHMRPESATQCMICLSEFEEGESLRRLPCTHVFHQGCIDEWLLHRSTSCCLCKVDVATGRQSD